jgi:hypothetical protein
MRPIAFAASELADEPTRRTLALIAIARSHRRACSTIAATSPLHRQPADNLPRPDPPRARRVAFRRGASTTFSFPPVTSSTPRPPAPKPAVAQVEGHAFIGIVEKLERQ